MSENEELEEDMNVGEPSFIMRHTLKKYNLLEHLILYPSNLVMGVEVTDDSSIFKSECMSKEIAVKWKKGINFWVTIYI